MTSPDECEDPYRQYDDPIYRQAASDAWVATRMERDKSLLTLSTSGIGLLVTLATTVGVGSGWETFFFILAGVSFILAIGFALHILSKNADYLKATITDDDDSADKLEGELDTLDRLVVVGFGAGVLASAAFGGIAALT